MKISYNRNKVWLHSKAGKSRTSSGKSPSKPKESAAKGLFSFGNLFGKTKQQKSAGGKESPVTRLSSDQPATLKVFKPAPKEIQKHAQTPTWKRTEKKFLWGFKKLPDLRADSLSDLGQKTALGVRYFLTKYNLVERLNILVTVSMLTSISLFLVYLCFFDTYFLVKNYRVTFAQGSYVSQSDTEEIINRIKNQKFLGFIPNNQYWFLNSTNLTAAARIVDPEIARVEVVRRGWPNSAELRITTRPILITLGINNSEYWRISQTGEVLSKDEAGLRENLVIVERPIYFDRPGVDLQAYSFSSDCDFENLNQNNYRYAEQCRQLNRFWYVIWLWNELDRFGVNYTKTVLPSLFDTDVRIETVEGSVMHFDASVMSRDIQAKRLESILQSDIKRQLDAGEIAYLDFRIAKKVFVCRQGQVCQS